LSIGASTVLGENGPRSLANTVSVDGSFTFGGGDDLTLTGIANLTGARVITVSNPAMLTFGGGLGESIVATDNLTKSGVGTLQFTSVATYAGTTTLSAQGGTLLLSGNGVLLDTGTIAIGQGAAFVIDNTSSTLPNRVRDLAAITLGAGQLAYLGNI